MGGAQSGPCSTGIDVVLVVDVVLDVGGTVGLVVDVVVLDVDDVVLDVDVVLLDVDVVDTSVVVLDVDVVVSGTVVVDVVVVVVTGGGSAAARTHGDVNTTGRYRSGRGHASRSMLRALFEIVTTNWPIASRVGSRCAWYVFIFGSPLRGPTSRDSTVVHGPHGWLATSTLYCSPQ